MNTQCLLDESLVPLAEAARSLPGTPHLSTITRWHSHGVRGVKLETVVIGGRRYTTTEAIDRFLVRLNAGADPP